MSSVKLLLVDDNPDILEILEEMLGAHFKIVGSLTSGGRVPEVAERLMPDVIVLDVSLGDVNGFDVARALRAKRCPAKLIFLSIHQSPEFVCRAFDSGAAGYVFKSHTIDLVRAIKLVAAGQTYNPVISPVADRD